MRARAQELAGGEHSWEAMTARTVTLYERLIA